MIKQLFGNRVAIKPLKDEEEKTMGGIVIPGKKGKKRLIGEVVAVGKGLILNDGTHAEMDIAVGMNVLYKQYAGISIDENGEEVLRLNAGDIIAEID